MNHVIPSFSKVKKHFAKAKQIECIGTDFLIDVSGDLNLKVVEDEITLEDNSHVIWSNGTYAKITKECKCKGCKCFL